MNRNLKAGLLATVSAVGISLLTAAPSLAFDKVDWKWGADLTEHLNTNVNVNVNIDPTGLVMVEGQQINIGDVKAKSIIDGVYNNQPAGAGTVDLGSTDVQFHYGIGGAMLNDGFESPNVSAGNVDETDHSPNINGTVTATVDLGTVTVPSTASLDAATELPSVVSAATAVANNLSIGSEVGTQVHLGQFAYGDGAGGISTNGFGHGSNHGYGGSNDNANLELSDSLSSLVQSGSLVKANIEAKSKVSDILNASVDSSSTAVANNMSISVEPVSAPNAMLIGDVTQFAYADVTAKSKVTNVTLNNYTGLGSISVPIVSSVATAVGNNASFSVKTPVISAP